MVQMLNWLFFERHHASQILLVRGGVKEFMPSFSKWSWISIINFINMIFDSRCVVRTFYCCEIYILEFTARKRNILHMCLRPQGRAL